MSELVPQNDEDEEDDGLHGQPGVEPMGFLDHLEDLRWSLIKPLAVFIISFVLVMVFISDVKDLLLMPLTNSLTEEGRATFEGLATRNPMGVYSAMFQIGLMVGATVASPFIVYYLGRFLGPALNDKERRMLIPGCIAVLILFLLGCSFSFFLMLPQAIDITIWFNGMMGFQLIWSPDSYFSFITWIVLGMGISFEFPVAIMVLVQLGVVTVAMLKRFRRVMVMILIIFAAILTPPDPVTQVMMAAPMYLLYELSIWIAAILMRRKLAAEAEEYESD